MKNLIGREDSINSQQLVNLTWWMPYYFNICCRYCRVIMSSSTSAWLLSPLECYPQKQNGWTICFCFWGWIMLNNWGERFQKHNINYYDKLLLYFKIFKGSCIGQAYQCHFHLIALKWSHFSTDECLLPIV